MAYKALQPYTPDTWIGWLGHIKGLSGYMLTIPGYALCMPISMATGI